MISRKNLDKKASYRDSGIGTVTKREFIEIQHSRGAKAETETIPDTAKIEKLKGD